MGHKIQRKTGRAGVIVHTLLAWLVLMSPSGVSGSSATPTGQHRSKNMLIQNGGMPAGLLAERQEKSQPGGVSGAGEKKSALEGQPENQSKNASGAATSKKPLKPFGPTERISADQAVDFPSDI